jgi:hypothetical protein
MSHGDTMLRPGKPPRNTLSYCLAYSFTRLLDYSSTRLFDTSSPHLSGGYVDQQGTRNVRRLWAAKFE